MKHIAILAGSPRKNGNTEILIQAFTEGAKSAGHSVDKINVCDLDIRPCRACDVCKKDARCAIRDDTEDCYRRLAAADVVVIATPIYFFSVSAQLKCLIDRLHNPIRSTFRVRKLVLLTVSADSKPSVTDSIYAMYDSVLKYFSLSDGGILSVRGVGEKGDILGNPLLEQARQLGASV